MKRLLIALCLFATPAWADDTTYFFPQASTNITTTVTEPVTHTMAVTGIRTVRIVGSTAIWVDMAGPATDTSTTSMFMPANVPEYFSAYQGINISVIADSASGTVYIVEMTP